MSRKRVRRDVDLGDLPPLTERQKAELYALAARLEGDIDTSEIPPLTAKVCADAALGRFCKPTKTSTTVRVDADGLAWLRAQGKGRQSRINAILRREMLAATADASASAGFARKGGAAPRSRASISGVATRAARSAASTGGTLVGTFAQTLTRRIRGALQSRRLADVIASNAKRSRLGDAAAA